MMGDIIKLRKKRNKYMRLKDDEKKQVEADILRREIVIIIGRIKGGSDRRYEHFCNRILEEITL